MEFIQSSSAKELSEIRDVLQEHKSTGPIAPTIDQEFKYESVGI